MNILTKEEEKMHCRQKKNAINAHTHKKKI